MEQQKLPNATLIIVLSIASIVLCCFYGLLGIILSIIAIILANKSIQQYNTNPQDYSNYSSIKTGKTIAIVGLVINILVLLFFIWFISVIGWDALQDEELMQERMEDLMNQ
tara:strand:- start:11 stop:343 length:333 start_codon:yes stop_codon:yes gene_type:complete